MVTVVRILRLPIPVNGGSAFPFKRLFYRRDFAVHDPGEIMPVFFYAMVSNPVLRKIIGADFFRAFAGSDLSAPLCLALCAPFLHFKRKKPRTQNLECLCPVLLLAA